MMGIRVTASADIGGSFPTGASPIFTHTECKGTSSQSQFHRSVTLENNAQELCGEHAIVLLYDYDMPPLETFQEGWIRMVDEDGVHYTKPYGISGTKAFRFDSWLSHLSIMKGYDNANANYPLPPGRILPASATDEAVKGGVYFYGSLNMCPQEGGRKWRPYNVRKINRELHSVCSAELISIVQAPLPAKPTAHDTASCDPTIAGPPSDVPDPRPAMFASLPQEVQGLYANMPQVPVVKAGNEFPASYKGCLERGCYRFKYPDVVTGTLFLCLHCGKSQTGSAARLIQHWTGAFGASVEGLSSYARVQNQTKTAACPKFRLSVEEIKRLAADGQSDCKSVCSANSWELTDAHGRPSKHRYSPDWTREDNKDAQRDHVLGIIFTASSFRSSEHV